MGLHKLRIKANRFVVCYPIADQACLAKRWVDGAAPSHGCWQVREDRAKGRSNDCVLVVLAVKCRPKAIAQLCDDAARIVLSPHAIKRSLRLDDDRLLIQSEQEDVVVPDRCARCNGKSVVQPVSKGNFKDVEDRMKLPAKGHVPKVSRDGVKLVLVTPSLIG